MPYFQTPAPTVLQHPTCYKRGRSEIPQTVVAVYDLSSRAIAYSYALLTDNDEIESATSW